MLCHIKCPWIYKPTKPQTLPSPFYCWMCCMQWSWPAAHLVPRAAVPGVGVGLVCPASELSAEDMLAKLSWEWDQSRPEEHVLQEPFLSPFFGCKQEDLVLILVPSAAKTVPGGSMSFSPVEPRPAGSDAMQKPAKSWAANSCLKTMLALLPPVPAEERKGVVSSGKESVHRRTPIWQHWCWTLTF